jgi:hypothetical protein
MCVACRIEPQVLCTVCGSYRRGKSTCGDVDILITPSDEYPQDSLPANSLSRLILALERRGFLTDHLSLPTGHKDYLASSALAQIQHVHSSSSRAGSAYAASKAPSRRSAGSGRTHSSTMSAPRSQLTTQQSAPGTQYTAPTTQLSAHASPPRQRLYSDTPVDTTQEGTQSAPPHTTHGALHVDAGPGDVSSDELPSGSEGDDLDDAGHYSDYGFTDEGEDGYGTQSGEEFDPEEGVVKYDTYGGKKKPSKHKLYFGSRGSYMGVCRLPHPESRYRRLDIKVRSVLYLDSKIPTVLLTRRMLCRATCRFIPGANEPSRCSTSPGRTPTTAGCATTPPRTVTHWTTR